MRAAVSRRSATHHARGTDPQGRRAPPELVDDQDEPSGDVVVDVTAAPLNPVDLSIASGRFYAGPPNTPYVPGVEGVGRAADGTRYWFETGAGYLGDGSMAERALVRPERAIELPDGVDDAVAGCLGVAGSPRGSRSRTARRSKRAKRCLSWAPPEPWARSRCRRRSCSAPDRWSQQGGTPSKLATLDADATVQLPATADELREAAGGAIDVVSTRYGASTPPPLRRR